MNSETGFRLQSTASGNLLRFCLLTSFRLRKNRVGKCPPNRLILAPALQIVPRPARLSSFSTVVSSSGQGRLLRWQVIVETVERFHQTDFDEDFRCTGKCLRETALEVGA